MGGVTQARPQSLWRTDMAEDGRAGEEVMESDSSLQPDSTYEDFRYRRGFVGSHMELKQK